jgi:hypothetical protein
MMDGVRMNDQEARIMKKDGITVKNGIISMYGLSGPVESAPSLLEANLMCFDADRKPEQGGLGRFGHYQNIVDILWNHSESRKKYDWQDYSIKMSKAMCEHPVLAIAGCGGSGKTDSAAVFSIVWWLVNPSKTMILATSTSLKDSKKRIWGSITDYLRACPGLPFKVIDSVGQVRTVDHTGKDKFSDKCGFALIAADKKNDKEAVGKLIGYHTERIMLVADELPELTEGVLEAFFGNISTNPTVALIGLGNPSDYFNPFGVLSQPRDGWESVTMNDEEWVTKRGYLIRLDAASSPNILAGKTIYPYLTTQERYEQAIGNLGENSAQFLRMYRAWFSSAGNEDVIFSGADIVKSNAMSKVKWREKPVKLAGLDPSFSNGGDRTCLVFLEYGLSVDDARVLQVDKIVFLKEDTTKKDSPRSYQIAKMVVDHCSREGVTNIQNFAMDITGAGAALADVITQEWGRGMHKTQFAGTASELPVSAFDNTPANKRYVNKVSELWGSAKELMLSGQLKGITNEVAKEMVSRRFEVVKGETARMKIESKTEMRQRGADSPDVFDAIAIIVDMLRSKKNFASKAKAGSGFIGSQVSGGARSAWSKILSRYGVQKQAARVLVR